MDILHIFCTFVINLIDMDTNKTKYTILNAARIVFIKRGYDDATMGDIATESGLCRRTVYSYFTSKYDVYKAVIDFERDQILSKLSVFANKSLSPKQKLIEYITCRFEVIKEMVDSNGTMRSGFFRNIWGLEHFRKSFDAHELLLIKQIISEGKIQGDFNVDNVHRTSEMLLYALRGFEVPYISGKIWKTNTKEEIRYETQKMLFGALGCSK